MRHGMWVLAGLCAIWAATPARAQSSASTILGGPNPQTVSFKPVDLSKSVAPAPAIAAGQNRFSFAGLFSKLPIPGYPVKRGISPLPPMSAFPSTRYANNQMVGTPPMLIGQPRNKPLTAPAPFIPSMSQPAGPGSNNK